METFPKRWRFVPRMWSVQDFNYLPSRIILHVLPSRHHERRCGRKCADISLIPSAAIAAAISSPLRLPSGSDRFTLKSPATNSSAPLGRSLIVATTLSIL